MAVHGQENKKCRVFDLIIGIFIVYTLLPLYCANNEDFFASTSDVEELFLLEQKLSELFLIENTKIDEDMLLLEKLLYQLKAENSKCEPFGNAKNYVSSNNLSYIMTQSIALLSLTAENTTEILESFPSGEEMNGAVSGLFLLHQTYHLNWTDLISHGLKVPPYFTNNRIKTDFNIYSKDFEVLGKIAFKRKLYDQAYEILNIALHIAKKEQEKEHIEYITSLVDVVIRTHDDTLKKYRNYSNQGVYSYQLSTNKCNNNNGSVVSENKALNNRKINLFTPFVTEKQKKEQFQKLCRGERLRSSKDDIGITSSFLHHNNPFLQLGPFKVENKNMSPYVAVIHQLFHPKETDAFIKYASPDLERSETFIKEGTLGSSMSRTTKQVYVPENDTRLSATGIVSDRIKMATKLRSRFWPKEESEEWQITNYGIGGVYTPHLDSVGNNGISLGEPYLGDRLATFLSFMTDVQVGGGTAFPFLGVMHQPKKGDAILWYNINQNGRKDLLTEHGGCPVLYGNKWIANKLIMSFAQHDIVPCSIDSYRNQRIPPLTNI